MPVITRSQSQRNLLPISENANSCFPSKLFTKPVGDLSYTTSSQNSLKNPVALKKFHRTKKTVSFSQKPQNGSRKHQSSDRNEQSQTATEVFSPNLSDRTITHWACETCSCPQGTFDYPVNSCIRCGHETDRHEEIESDWDTRCSYICEKKKLIISIMVLLDTMRVVIIRATPQAGKSILLRLLGHHVLRKRKELEPVFINWETREERKDLPYTEYLTRNKSEWQQRNSKYRPYNPAAKTLYLIDEAQKSYEDADFWTRELKNRGTRGQSMFVLVCLYGADVSSRPSQIESLSLTVSPVQRIELRPSHTKNSYILFTLEETTVVVQKWAFSNQYELTEGFYEYVHVATDGHPGMVGFVLRHFDDYVLKVWIGIPRTNFCTDILSLVD